MWHSPSTSEQNIGNRTPLSDGRKKKYIEMFGSYAEPFNCKQCDVNNMYILYLWMRVFIFCYSLERHTRYFMVFGRRAFSVAGPMVL